MRWEEMLGGDSRTAHDAANEAAARRPGNLLDRQRAWEARPDISSSTTPPERPLPVEARTCPVHLTVAQMAAVVDVVAEAGLAFADDDLDEALRKLRACLSYAVWLELGAL